MADAEPNKARSLRKVILLCLLGLILSATGACAFRSQPLYQPLSQSSNWDGYRQGYFEYQIDDQTYLIGYSNYVTAHSIFEGGWYTPSLKWLKGAQEYALYRAAEFTRNKGQQSFIVLHRDDWYYTGYVRAGYRTSRHFMVSPGAWLIIRFLDMDGTSVPNNDDRIYLADTLLEKLARANRGLVAHQSVEMAPEREKPYVHRGFQRWRSSSSIYDSVPVPGVLHQGLLGYKDIYFESNSRVTQTEPGRFTIAIWDDAQISPMQILWQCVALATGEGNKFFKLKNWTTEEYIGGKYMNYTGKVWFRNTVDVVLQHQKERNSLEPVFEVDEVLSRMDPNGASLPR